MPTTGNIRQMGEGEENRATRPVVVVNFQQLLSQVEATTRNVYSCINENGVLYQDQEDNAYVYLDSLSTPTLQTLYDDLRSQQWNMVTYATAMSVEASVKYNHIHAEAAQAITTAQIYLQAAEMQPDPQPPAPVTQTQNTNPDDLMDVGEQTPAGVATENHLGTEIVDEQVL